MLKMKTWLKGGLIGAGIGFLITVFSSFFTFFISGPCLSHKNCSVNVIAINDVFQSFIWKPLSYIDKLFPCNQEGCLVWFLLAPVFISFVGFLIGAIIGLIIQKLKK